MAALLAIAKGHKPSIANFPMAKLSFRSDSAVERPRYGPVAVGLTVFSPRSPLPCGTKACRRPQSWLLMAEILYVEHQVGTVPIELFVGQNLDEVARDFRALRAEYNARVAQVEVDRALLIKLPFDL